MSHQMSRFFATVEKLIGGIDSGEIVLDTALELADSSRLAALAMREGLHNIGRILMQSDQRASALCSRLWDAILYDVQKTLQTYFSEDDVCISYWLRQPEFIVGYYTADVKDRLGDCVFNKLPLDDSLCGRSLHTNQPIFVVETTHSPFVPPEISKHVGSLVVWPVRVFSANAHSVESPIAVLLVEARHPGVIHDDPNIRFLIESLAGLFELSYHITAGGLSGDSSASVTPNPMNASNISANDNLSVSK